MISESRWENSVAYAKAKYGGNRPRYRAYIHISGEWQILLRPGARLDQYLKTFLVETKSVEWRRFTPLH